MTVPPLYAHQHAAVHHLHQVGRGALFMDMGWGKTAATLAALTEDHLPALVVAPRRVLTEVWPEEVPLWRPDLRIELAHGTKAQRQRVLANTTAPIVGISRDNLADAITYQQARQYRTVILDESSSFKSRSSGRWKAARQLTLPPGKHPHLRMPYEKVPYVWELTGTPSPNGLIDLWAPIYLLDAGARLGTTLTGYRERYFMPGGRTEFGHVTSWVPRPETPDHVHRLLDDIAISMFGDLEDVPPTTVNPVQVPLPPKARALYREMKKNLVADMAILGGGVHTAQNAATLTNKLSQITAGFMYEDKELAYDPARPKAEHIHDEKLLAVQEVVAGTGSPVLVFYRFRHELTRLQKVFGTDLHTINEEGIQRKWNAGQVPVLAAHPASAGHGLNLQKGPGHTVVWTSLPWSLEEWMQANRRLSRPGQRNPVVIHVLLAPQTVDGAILDKLQQKKSVQQALMDHLESPL